MSLEYDNINLENKEKKDKTDREFIKDIDSVDSLYIDLDKIKKESFVERRVKLRRVVSEIREDTFNRCLKTILPITLAAGIAIGGLSTSAVKGVVDKYSSEKQIGEKVMEFQADYIYPNTHRTQDNEGYWYDYEEISKAIDSYEDRDEAIYYCYINIGSLQTGRVIKELGEDSFTDYIAKHNFKDIKEYDKAMHDYLVKKNKDSKMRDEINQMIEDHKITYSTEDSNSMGGK